jgi:type IV secretion system protein VirD4
MDLLREEDAMFKLCRLILIGTVLVSCGCLVAIAMSWGGLGYIAIGIVLTAALAKRRYGPRTAFGTARWADAEDLRARGMLRAKSGLIIGRIVDWGKQPLPKAVRGLFDYTLSSQEACEQLLRSIQFRPKPTINPSLVRLPNAVHTAIFAPTGVGKGVSCVVPFLKTCSESMVVVDFKGENARLTAEHRRRVFGHQIVFLDPFTMVSQTPATYNDLDFIDKDSPTAIDDCRDLAEALVIRTGQEKDPHWVDSAEAWISALIALVVRFGESNDRSLQTVRTLLSPEKLEMAIKLMCASDAWGGMLARMGNQLTNFKDKELGSTLTTTNRFLRFLDTPAIADSTKSSSFDPADLRKGKTTVYVILPPEHMRAQSAWLRLCVGSLLRAVVRGGLQEENKVHFVLDEAASFSQMDLLGDAVDKYRGYGVRLQFYYQSVGQLKSCWPADQGQTLLSNTTQTFFGVNDLPTAEYVSGRLGDETIVLASGGKSDGTTWQSSHNGQGSSSYSTNRSGNWQFHGRKLLKPEEVMALHSRTAVTFTPGVAPICTTLLRYYEEPNLGQRSGLWERFKAMTNVVIGSLVLLSATGLLAIGVAASGRGQMAAQQLRGLWHSQSQKP